MKKTLLFLLVVILFPIVLSAGERFDVRHQHILTEFVLNGTTYTDIAPATQSKEVVERAIGRQILVEATYTGVTYTGVVASDKGGREYLAEFDVSSNLESKGVGVILNGVDQGVVDVTMNSGLSGQMLRRQRPTSIKGVELSVPDLGSYFSIFVLKAKMDGNDLEVRYHVALTVDYHYGQPVTGEPKSRMLYNPVISGSFPGDNYVPEGAEVGFAWTDKYLGYKPNLNDQATLDKLDRWTPAIYREGEYLGWPTNVGRAGYFNYTFAVRHGGKIVRTGDLVTWTVRGIERVEKSPSIGTLSVEAYDFWGYGWYDYYAHLDVKTGGKEAQLVVQSCHYDWVFIYDVNGQGHYEWMYTCHSNGWEKLDLDQSGDVRTKIDIDPCQTNDITAVLVWKDDRGFEFRWTDTISYRPDVIRCRQKG